MRPIFPAALLLLLAVAAAQSAPVTAQKPSQNPVASDDELVRMAAAMADMGRYDEAVSAYTLVLDHDPQNPYALAGRGIAYAWTNRVDEAARDLAAVERIAPDTAVVHRLRAIIANRRSDTDAELLELTKSLQSEPRNPFALRFRAAIYEQRQQYEAALIDAEAYIRSSPDEPEAYELKANILSGQRKWDAALSQAQLLKTRFATDPRALVTAARIFESGGRRAEALDLATKAIGLDDGFYYLWKVRAGVRRWDDFVGRRLDLDEALKLAPGNLDIVADLGLLEFEQGNWQAAQERFSNILAKDSKDFLVLAYRAMTFDRLGNHKAASQDFDQALAAASGPGDLSRICSHLAMAGVLLRSATALCDRAVDADPNLATYLVNRGFLRLRMNNLPDAIDDYTRAIAKDPNIAEAYYGRAIAFLRTGARENSDRDRREAVAVSPAVAESFVQHGFRDLETESVRSHLLRPPPHHLQETNRTPKDTGRGP